LPPQWNSRLKIPERFKCRAQLRRARRNCRSRAKSGESLIENGKSLDDLSEGDIEANLYTRGLPEVDLLVRTSGNFASRIFFCGSWLTAKFTSRRRFFPIFAAQNISKRLSIFKNARGVSAALWHRMKIIIDFSFLALK
jgi:hypothetical protein